MAAVAMIRWTPERGLTHVTEVLAPILRTQPVSLSPVFRKLEKSSPSHTGPYPSDCTRPARGGAWYDPGSSVVHHRTQYCAMRYRQSYTVLLLGIIYGWVPTTSYLESSCRNNGIVIMAFSVDVQTVAGRPPDGLVPTILTPSAVHIKCSAHCCVRGLKRGTVACVHGAMPIVKL
jgi:hypothetical protein